MPDLEEALRQVQVDRLGVRVPPPLPGNSAIHSMSPAVSLCVSTLLNAGTSFLYLEGAFIEYDVIARAVASSSLLKMIFGSHPSQRPSAHDVEGYRKIMLALASCATLKNISLAQPDFLALHTIIGDFQKNGGPRLTAVCITMEGWTFDQEQDNAPRHAQHLAAFMDMVGKIPTLTECQLHQIPIQDIDYLERAILAPLGQSRSLTTLHIDLNLHNASPLAHVLSAAQLIAFKARSPSLRHLHCSATGTPRCKGETAGKVMDALLQLRTPLNPPDVMKAFADALSSPSKFNLFSLRVNGFHLTVECCNMLFDAIDEHPWLSKLDLQHCAIHLPSAMRLKDSLARNDRIESVLLPDRFDAYYLVIQTAQGPMALGFPSIDVLSHSTDGFSIHPYRALPAPHRDVVTRLLPSLHSDGQILFNMARSKPLENQRNVHRRTSHLPVDARPEGITASEPPAQAQLATAHRVWRPHELSPLQLEHFKAASNAIVQRDPQALHEAIEAGAPVNVVDELARNELLVLAAPTGDPLLVSLLVEGHATDFGGHGFMAATHPAVVALLSSSKTGLTTTTTTTTTTITTTTATAVENPGTPVTEDINDYLDEVSADDKKILNA